MKRLIVIFYLFLFVSCQQQQQENSLKSPPSMKMVKGSQSSGASNKDDFSDLKKRDDEGCEDKTAQDVERELEKKMAEMKKAQEKGKTMGFNFNSGEPGCDPNADKTKKGN